MSTLYRATFEIQPVEGRTLVGLAAPWDRPTSVRDLIGGRMTDPYLEAFAPTSADVSLRQRADRPVFVRHDYGSDPIGVATFARSAEGLVYEAPLSKTARADEMLELVQDGAMRSVSIGFRPVRATRKRVAEGDLTYRTEIALRELSLAPTGFGQYAEAGVLAVRDLTDPDEDPGALAAAVDASIDAALKCLDPTDDDFNPAQAVDLLVAAETAIDGLLEAFGVADADDLDPADGPAMMVAPMRSKVVAGRALADLHRRTRREIASRPIPFIGVE